MNPFFPPLQFQQCFHSQHEQVQHLISRWLNTHRDYGKGKLLKTYVHADIFMVMLTKNVLT